MTLLAKSQTWNRISAMPESIRGMYSGTLQAYRQSLSTEPMLIITALLAVYIVLGVLYESYIHPITILSTLPSAGRGSCAGFDAFPYRPERHRTDRNHFVDRIREEECHSDDRFRDPRRAEPRQKSERSNLPACLLRFRPILMTTMAACLAHFLSRWAPGPDRNCAARSASPSWAA